MTDLRDPYVHPFGPNPTRWNGSLQPWAPVAYKISLCQFDDWRITTHILSLRLHDIDSSHKCVSALRPRGLRSSFYDASPSAMR
ncbi:hypothetical protein IG631_10845 [Alternaria alternata]|nr:hypothetical protein IG631_10845 [Alternaria alternata]